MSEQETENISEDSSGFRVVELSREPIELYKILKFESMVVSGGEAKAAVASGQVLLNGEPEIQKRKKVVSGDTIEFGEERIILKLSPTANIESETAPQTADSKTPKPEKKNAPKERKAISVRSTGRKK
jgi:ribosome-associated protein